MLHSSVFLVIRIHLHDFQEAVSNTQCEIVDVPFVTGCSCFTFSGECFEESSVAFIAALAGSAPGWLNLLAERIPAPVGSLFHWPSATGHPRPHRPQLCRAVCKLAVGICASPLEIVVAHLGLCQVWHWLQLSSGVRKGTVCTHFTHLLLVVCTHLRLPELIFQRMRRQHVVHRIHGPLSRSCIRENHRLASVAVIFFASPMCLESLKPMHVGHRHAALKAVLLTNAGEQHDKNRIDKVDKSSATIGAVHNMQEVE
mmetsp:Transcript_78925/g.189479  ORF Transcript_78925/g.189479 Transcript_78925/m.189479 type:complete len:256 (-) Transcript_78925:3062-3829(-)